MMYIELSLCRVINFLNIEGFSFFFCFNVFLLICGIVGFFGLTLNKSEYFGYLLHCSWFCGSFNLIIGLIITIFLFYGGVILCNYFI